MLGPGVKIHIDRELICIEAEDVEKACPILIINGAFIAFDPDEHVRWEVCPHAGT